MNMGGSLFIGAWETNQSYTNEGSPFSLKSLTTKYKHPSLYNEVVAGPIA